jgi:hypothetical protein
MIVPFDEGLKGDIKGDCAKDKAYSKNVFEHVPINLKICPQLYKEFIPFIMANQSSSLCLN